MTGITVLPPARPDGLGAAAPSVSTVPGQTVAPTNTAAIPAAATSAAATAEPSTNLISVLFGAPPVQARNERLPPLAGRAQIDALISHHAKLNGVPESLVHRVVVRESKYNPRAVGAGGAMGLMQIKTATARGVGYGGGPAGLLDAETNITYAVKYLAGAYRTADGNHDLSVRYYASGYFYDAKRKGLIQNASGETVRRGAYRQREAAAAAPEPAATTPASLFSGLGWTTR